MDERPDASTISELFRNVLALSPQTTALSYGDALYTWASLEHFSDRLAQTFDQAGIPPGAPAVWIARNNPSSAVVALGLLLSRNCIMPVNPHRSGAAVAEEASALKPAIIIAVKADWTPDLMAAAEKLDVLALEVDIDEAHPVKVVLAPRVSEQQWELRPDVIMERVTSGTTGPPKRIPIDAATFIKAFEFIAPKGSKGAIAPRVVQRSPSFVFSSLAHSAGLWHVLAALIHARPVVLHAKFSVEGLRDLMRRHPPKTLKLTPAMVSMILHDNVPHEELKSLLAIRTGSAPLDPGVRQAFQKRYGVPILVDYGASEFVGGIATWSLEDWTQFGAEKSSSVGRLRADMLARVEDPETGGELPLGQVGVLCLNTPRAGGAWVRTTDLASLDAEGFVYLHGRADEAINRGGFKVLPEKVAEIMRQHPGVRDVIVLGIKDEKLGQAPIAVVELAIGKSAPNGDDLKDLVRAQLAPYFVPVAVEFWKDLPRNASTKVDRAAVRERLKGKYDF